MAHPTEVFLRGVWRRIIPCVDDLSWVQRIAALPAEDEPLGDRGPIIRKMLDAGISEAEIARFAQIIGYETAFGLCCHLEDPIASYEGIPTDGDVVVPWGLFLIDPETGEPCAPLGGLHESMLSMDPSGREMRPQ
ncbi:MAG: hypothetical protein IT196_08245 [Acidimicrobiales bacterium]|nr:hypothetical protein [Acidimicrobiales bacterium]